MALNLLYYDQTLLNILFSPALNPYKIWGLLRMSDSNETSIATSSAHSRCLLSTSNWCIGSLVKLSNKRIWYQIVHKSLCMQLLNSYHCCMMNEQLICKAQHFCLDMKNNKLIHHKKKRIPFLSLVKHSSQVLVHDKDITTMNLHITFFLTFIFEIFLLKINFAPPSIDLEILF